MRLVMPAVDKGPGVEPLAHQAPLHVDKAGQNCVDRAICNKRFQVFKRHGVRHGMSDQSWLSEDTLRPVDAGSERVNDFETVAIEL